MRLNTSPVVLLITLTVLNLFITSSYSLALAASPEEEKSAEQKDTDSAEKKTDDTVKIKVTKKIDIAAPIDSFKQQQDDIEHYLTQEKIVPLLVGPDSYLTAINEQTTGLNKGVMVLIPDWQQSIATPNALNQLRKNMPQYGWTTITLHPPHQPSDYPSQVLTSEERNSKNTESLTKYSKKFADIMLAVIEKAKSYPGVIIIVAEGSHAALIVDVCQQGMVSSPSAMVMLSSYMPTLPENTKLAQQLAATDYPVFDLYLQRDHYLVVANAKVRKETAKREMKVYYRQKQLNNRTTGYYPEETLTREIIGWLSSIGW